MDYALIIYAFSAGMVATVNPCGFAMLPAYVSYYLATGEKGASPASAGRRLGRALLVGGTLVAGFLVLFALAGALISLGAYVLVRAMPWIGLFVGATLILLGGWLLLGRHLALPALPRPQARRERSLRSIFLFGVGYGLASLSCTLPIFLVVVGSAFTLSGAGAGLVQFLAYGLGMGVVLMALTLSLALFEGVLVGSLRRLVPYVERAGAVLLVGAGLYIVYYWLTLGRLLGPGGV
ncbi:MAG: cytochrome c biogenesis protein CcdA [Chloroflexi bacterium]|nr:MAG: cytochrome c biogenesis protein CcdA [Chloroflexota bacterium]